MANGKNMRPLRILLQAFGQLPGRMPKNPLPELKGTLKGKTFIWGHWSPLDFRLNPLIHGS